MDKLNVAASEWGREAAGGLSYWNWGPQESFEKFTKLHQQAKAAVKRAIAMENVETNTKSGPKAGVKTATKTTAKSR